MKTTFVIDGVEHETYRRISYDEDFSPTEAFGEAYPINYEDLMYEAQLELAWEDMCR